MTTGNKQESQPANQPPTQPARIEIWTRDGCGRCESVLAALAEKYRICYSEIVEYDVDRLADFGSLMRDEVMAVLQMQDRELPVVRVGGRFVDPEEFISPSPRPSPPGEGVCDGTECVFKSPFSKGE